MFLLREVTKENLSAVQRLRAEVFVEKGFLDPRELQGGLDIDMYDADARHVGVFLPTGEVVGALRIISTSPKRELQIQKYCGIIPEPADASVEASRFVVHRSCRKSNVSFSMMKWFIDTCTEMGVVTVYAVVEQWLLDNFLMIGLPFERIGEDVEIFHSMNFPVAVKLADMVPGIKRADESRQLKLGPFFENPLEVMFS